MSQPSVIIGSCDDPHVNAVLELLNSGTLVLDVARLHELNFEASTTALTIGDDNTTVDLSHGWRGWIRRLSPPDWEDGIVIGSHDAAAMAAWLSLLATILRHPDANWLTNLDSQVGAENKLIQYITASRLGIPVPDAAVTNIPARAHNLGSQLIAKPLGPGHFRDDDGEWRTVFTEPFDPHNSDIELLQGPPFIIQRYAHATAHKRVVTVGANAWAFTLDSKDLPIDWREEPRAHRDWEHEPNPQLEHSAIRLAAAMNVGYSSQDWIANNGTLEFIDLNPGGQWLFLPEPASAQITRAIATWIKTR